MQRSHFFLSVFIFFCTFFILQTQHIAAAQDPCEPLIIMYCTSCHNTERICKALEKKDEQAWKKTLSTMAEYGDIDEPTQDQVFTCVNAKKTSDPAFCKK